MCRIQIHYTTLKWRIVKVTFFQNLFLVGLLFILGSCRDVGTKTTITLDPDRSTCKRTARIESFIQLETSDSTLVGDITTLEFYKDRIYVFDKKVSKTLFVFDRNGKFLNRVKRGKGPGEIIEPWDFCINREEGTILLWDQMTFKLNTYDLNLSYLKSEVCPRLAIRNMSHLGGEDFLIFSQFYLVEGGEVIQRELYDYLVYKDNLTSIRKKLIKSNPKTRLVTLINPISKVKGNYFISPGDNHIYKLENDEIKPILNFDLGKYQITDEDLDKGHRYYRREIRKGNKIGYLGDLFVNEDYAAVSYRYRNSREFIIVNRKTNEVSNSIDLCSVGHLPVCSIKGLDDRNCFVGVVDAQVFHRYMAGLNGETIVPDSVDMFSNQVLMKFVLEE